MRYVSAAAFMMLALAGCQAGPGYPPVPPPRAEVMGKPPVTQTALIWQPGHWNWTGAGYEWIPGDFVPRAGHSDLWRPGYWEQVGMSWRWVPAQWLP